MRRPSSLDLPKHCPWRTASSRPHSRPAPSHMGARLGYQTHQFLSCIGALQNDSSDTFVHKRRGQHFFHRHSGVYRVFMKSALVPLSAISDTSATGVEGYGDAVGPDLAWAKPHIIWVMGRTHFSLVIEDCPSSHRSHSSVVMRVPNQGCRNIWTLMKVGCRIRIILACGSDRRLPIQCS